MKTSIMITLTIVFAIICFGQGATTLPREAMTNLQLDKEVQKQKIVQVVRQKKAARVQAIVRKDYVTANQLGSEIAAWTKQYDDLVGRVGSLELAVRAIPDTYVSKVEASSTYVDKTTYNSQLQQQSQIVYKPEPITEKGIRPWQINFLIFALIITGAITLIIHLYRRGQKDRLLTAAPLVNSAGPGSVIYFNHGDVRGTLKK